VGYTIVNAGVEIGVISEIEEYPQQEMATINYNKKDILIPLNEQFIIKLDNKKKVIEMELPEGLLEL
jgi:16S rRNA processing protein RimM